MQGTASAANSLHETDLHARIRPVPLLGPFLPEPHRALCGKDYGPLAGSSRARWGGRGKTGMPEEHAGERRQPSHRRVHHDSSNEALGALPSRGGKKKGAVVLRLWMRVKRRRLRGARTREKTCRFSSESDGATSNGNKRRNFDNIKRKHQNHTNVSYWYRHLQ